MSPLEGMKDRMERFALLPFSAGCVSTSSVAVSAQQPRRSKPETNSSPREIRKGEEEEGLSSEDMKSSIISSGLQMLSKSFRNFSQLFVFKEMEMEMEMEIGLPTDVKHLQHIGLDDGCDNLINPEMLVADFDKPQVSGSSYLRNHEEQEFKIYEAATLDVVDKLASGNFVESLVTKTGDFFIVAKAQPTN